MSLFKRVVMFFKPKSSRKIVEEFIEAFTGRCMICSVHDFGLNNGLCKGEVKPHKCIEKT